MLTLELVLPCYNEAKNLADVLKRTIDTAQASGLTSDTFQLVLVENGSKDDSSAVLDQLKQGPYSKWFRKVSVTVNQGYGFGIWSGLQTTSAPFVAWSHADQQCDPIHVFKGFHLLYKSQNPKRLLIKGVRSGRNWKDKIVSRVFELCARILLGLRIYEMNAQPKVFHRDLLKTMTNPPYTFAFDLYALYHAQKAGYAIQTLPVLFPPRIHGVSSWASHFFSRYKTILGILQYMWRLRMEEGPISTHWPVHQLRH